MEDRRAAILAEIPRLRRYARALVGDPMLVLADANLVCRPESALRADATARSARSTFFSSASMSISSTAAHASAARASAASASASRAAAI